MATSDHDPRNQCEESCAFLRFLVHYDLHGGQIAPAASLPMLATHQGESSDRFPPLLLSRMDTPDAIGRHLPAISLFRKWTNLAILVPSPVTDA